jgi:hypothetical protein
MVLHTRLENIQPPPSMDGIVLVMIDGLVHGATNESMTFVLKDQIESGGSRVNLENFTSI